MYQIRHTKPAYAAAQILMTIMKEGGYWWVHADEDEGFRMARLGTPYGDRLAKSGSPSLAGPFGRDTDLVTLIDELHKAQRAEYVKNVFKPYPILGKARLIELRQTIMDALEDQPMTVHQMADLCGTTTFEVATAINPLRKYGRIVPQGNVVAVRGGRAFYWQKAAA